MPEKKRQEKRIPEKKRPQKPEKLKKTDRPEKTGSRCRISGKCGGCQYIDTPYDEQIRAKQEYAEDLLSQFGKVEPVIRMKNPDHYRNKVTSVFSPGKGRPVCGIYQKGTRQVLEVSSCLIENTHADRIVQSIRDLAGQFGIPVYDPVKQTGELRYVQIRMAYRTHQIMVTLVAADASFPRLDPFVKKLAEVHPEITTVILNINTRTDAMILGNREKVLYGPGKIEDTLCGKRFAISSSSFYQVNSIQTEKLYNIAIDLAGLSGKESILDTYCGIGTIGIIASGRAAHVTGVEINKEAVKDAVFNVKLNDCRNVDIVCSDAGRFMLERAAGKAAFTGTDFKNPDVVFMDPPRAGASEDFLKALITLSPSRVIYISCNPETLARDLAVLTDAGYHMKKAVPVDMFPYTEDLETIAALEYQGTERKI